jgi:superfamily II DNA or RNA helicase
METTSPLSLSKREEIQKKALEEAKGHLRCGLAISMGVGKTFIGLQHMDWYLKRINPDAVFLVVAPKRSIFTSWFDDMDKFGLSYLKDRVTVTTYLSLNKQSLQYDVLYLDECHSLLYSHELWLNSYSGKIIGLTGTPPRFSESEKGQMVSRFCPIVFSYITDDAVDDRILNDYRIIVHKVNLSKLNDHVVTTKTKTWKTSEEKNYEYWCNRVYDAASPSESQFSRISRMRALMEYRSKERYAARLLKDIDDKCIIFCNTQDQAERLCSHSYHSSNPDNEENIKLFKDGDVQCLSCVLQLSEGVNIPNLRNAIILHSYANERKAAQRIGRVLRLNPDEVATVHILMYVGTVDEEWVRKALLDFDPSKITYRDVHTS